MRLRDMLTARTARTALRPSLLALLILAGCARESDKPDPRDLNAAREAGLAFDVRMKADIMARLERGEDPVAVYLAYTEKVPGWGKAISDAGRFEFSRTSLSVRNPANAPDSWESRKMEEFSFLMDAGFDPETLEASEIVQEGEQKVFRWMRPVQMTEGCLACHGEKPDERVKLLLGQEYPADEATGYTEGQIGGAYSVRRVLSVGGKAPPAYAPTPVIKPLPSDQRSPDDAPPATPVQTPAADGPSGPAPGEPY